MGGEEEEEVSREQDTDENLPDVPKDGWGKYAPTMQLHGYCMRWHLGKPALELIDASGDDHCRLFIYRASVRVRGETVETMGKHSTKKAAKHFAALSMLNLLKKDYETLKANDIDPKTAPDGPSANMAIQDQVEKAKVTANAALPSEMMKPSADTNSSGPSKLTNNQKKRQAKKYKKQLEKTPEQTTPPQQLAQPATNWPHSGWKDEQGNQTSQTWRTQSSQATHTILGRSAPSKPPKPQQWGNKARESIDEAQRLLAKETQEAKKTKPVWSGWETNTEWKPQAGYTTPRFDYSEYDDVGCETAPDMRRPNMTMIVDDTNEVVTLAAPSADAARRLAQMKELKEQMKKKAEQDKAMMPPPSMAKPADDGMSKQQKRKEMKIMNKIIKPKGWSENWSDKEASNQGYEVHYTEEDIKFGFPTVKESRKSQLSIDSIWSDQLFDTDRYQDWEDEWSEFDRKKQQSGAAGDEYVDVSGQLPTPVNPDTYTRADQFKKPPDILPPRLNLPPEFKPSSRDAWAKGFQDALRELEQEAIWKAKDDEKKEGPKDLPKSARIQNFIDDWIKQSLGVIGTQFLYEFYSSNGLLYGYYCALCCSDWPSTTHQETIRVHLTSHGHKLAYFRRQYFAAYRDITQWPLYGADALRDYDLEEYFEDEVLKKNSSEFAQFKNINVTVRHVQHRKIVITQAEKLRDGFFLKTKTQRKKSKMMEWQLDEWACPSYPCDTVNPSERRTCLSCGSCSPSDPYFFYHIKSSKEEQTRKEREERRASKYAIKDKRRHFYELVKSGAQLTAGPVLSKHIRAMDHIPRMTEDEMAFFRVEKKRIDEMDREFERQQEAEEDALRDELDLDPTQPVPMEDALVEVRSKETSGDKPEEGELGASDDSEYDSDEAEKEEQLDEAWSAGQFDDQGEVPLGGHNFFRDIKFQDGKKREEEDQIRADMEKLKVERGKEQEKGDGEKTRKRRRRAIQAARKKALATERPEVRQLLSRQKWVPRKSDNGWWLKAQRDGMWLCKRCANLNLGHHRFCGGCDLRCPEKGSIDAHFYALESAIRGGATKRELNTKYPELYDPKVRKLKLAKLNAVKDDEAEPDDIRGLPLIMSREYAKDHGLFGAEADEVHMTPWMKESRDRRHKHAEHYNALMAKEGVVDLPDESRFHNANGTLGHRCRERIVRAQQLRAMDQLKGTGKSGYLAKWRKNYSQSGWWCDLCDFFSYFPEFGCSECGSARPASDVLWKYAYRKEVREEAVANIERAIESDTAFTDTNYLIGRGQYAQVQAPSHLDSATENDWAAQQRRQVYYTGRNEDLACESQKIAAYNMMVCMTEGMTGEKAGIKGIHLEQDDDEDIGELVRREIETEDAVKAREREKDERQEGEFLDKLTSVPLLDKNNQFISFEEKLEIYKHMFEQYTQLHEEMNQLSSDSDEDKEESKSKKLQEAQRKRREDDFKSHLAFLHHEDFLNQLGQEAIPQVEVKTEIPEEQQVPYRNRFADEFDATVPEAIVDLCSSSSSSDSDDIDDEFYDRRRERDAKGRYTIPHRRGPRGSPLRDMVRQTEEELNATKRKKNEPPPVGISTKQWRGKSDLQKLREEYRGVVESEVDNNEVEEEDEFIKSRRRHSNEDDKATASGLQRIQVESFTQGHMSEREILRMNDKLFNVEALKEGGNRQQRRWREEGLYFDSLGRRKYRDDHRPSESRRRGDRRDERSSSRSSRDDRRDDRRDSRERRPPRWGPDHPDFKHGVDKLPYWYVEKHGLHEIDKDRKTWSHSSQNDKDDLMPIKSWGYDKSRLRKDIDDSREGKRREHMWGSRGEHYESRRESSRSSSRHHRRERSKSPDRNETEHEKRKRLEDEYKQGYERARREIARRSVSVMRDLGPTKEKSVSAEYMRDEGQRMKHRQLARKLAQRGDKELDERDEDMVDDIVDILYSRKYGKEITSFEKSSKGEKRDKERKRGKRKGDRDEEKKEERRVRREHKKAKKEKKKTKKEEKRREMEKLEQRMKSEIKRKMKDRSIPKDQKVELLPIRREKQPSQDRVLRVHSSESSPDSDSSSLPTDEDSFFDIPSPAEDGEVMDEKQELTTASFDKISREFTMKERIRQRLIERESFLPFGSVRFDTKDDVVHQTDIQKMFDDLKSKVNDSKEAEKTAESKEQRQRSMKFMDSVSRVLDRSQMTDIETDNEFDPHPNSSSDEDVDIGLANAEPDPTIGMERVNFAFKGSTQMAPPSIGFDATIDETDDTVSLAETDVSIATTVALDNQIRRMLNVDEKKERRKKKPKQAVNEPTPPSQFGSTAITSVPAIVPKPTKDVFGRGDLRDKVKREEQAPSDDNRDDDDNDDASSVYDPLSMFQKRNQLNPPKLSSPPEPRHHTEDRDEKKKKRKKRRSAPSSPPPPRRRSRSRSPRRTRSDRRRDELKRKLDSDNFTTTRSNTSTNDEIDLLGVAFDSKESAKLQAKLEKKKQLMMQRKEEQERKQRQLDERRSVAHIVGESSKSSRKRRQRDESPPDSVEKKIGLSDDLDLVKQRLLNKADNPRIKTTVTVDSDAESEITLAPSMVLNEGTSLSNSSKRAKVNFASLAAISKADEIRKDDKEADSKLSKMSSAISSNENEKAVELASDSQPEPQ